MKICSKCRTEHDRPNARYCRACHAAYTRNWRKTHQSSEESRRKDTVRSYAHVYLKRGKIERAPCVVCGKPAQMHHPDYNKPLDIIWLCHDHHTWLHTIIEHVPAPTPVPDNLKYPSGTRRRRFT